MSVRSTQVCAAGADPTSLRHFLAVAKSARRTSPSDGFERQFATNYLGPFARTAPLFPAIKPKPGSRIVTVSSSASKTGKIDFNNLQSERHYGAMSQAYAQSKLANSIFALELQRRLAAAGSPIFSTAAHPGYAATNLQADHLSLGLKFAMAVLKPFLSQDAAHGALPTLYAAVAPEAVPGGYYGPDRMFEMKGHPTAVSIAKAAQDPVTARRPWAESERLTGIAFPLAAA